VWPEELCRVREYTQNIHNINRLNSYSFLLCVNMNVWNTANYRCTLYWWVYIQLYLRNKSIFNCIAYSWIFMQNYDYDIIHIVEQTCLSLDGPDKRLPAQHRCQHECASLCMCVFIHTHVYIYTHTYVGGEIPSDRNSHICHGKQNPQPPPPPYTYTNTRTHMCIYIHRFIGQNSHVVFWGQQMITKMKMDLMCLIFLFMCIDIMAFIDFWWQRGEKLENLSRTTYIDICVFTRIYYTRKLKNRCIHMHKNYRMTRQDTSINLIYISILNQSCRSRCIFSANTHTRTIIRTHIHI